MSANRIRSHAAPSRYLKQHIAEIIAAGEAILAQHGRAPFRAEVDPLSVDLARLHDLGKGSAAFQTYIANPDGYAGDPVDKAHTHLSLVLAVEHEAVAAADPARLVSLALSVKGHHGGQPYNDDLYLDLKDDARRDALLRQLPSVDIGALAGETGLALAPVVDPLALVRRAMRGLQKALGAWRALSKGDMVRARFVARAAYSVLLEADKAFLAVERDKVKEYLHRPRAAMPPSRVDAMCQGLDETPMSALRARARALVHEGFAARGDAPLLTLTLPTGAGKTLLAARWALEERARSAEAIDTPTVILALPMLSIVDQTEKVWRDLLGVADEDGDTLLPYHSLSERTYDPELDRGTTEFFIDTWRSEVVVTTFDQLLLALYSDRAKHAMRYHRLLHARIVIDEVQCVPPILWTALTEGLSALTRLGRTKVLAMSATPSPCLEGVATEVLGDPGSLYAELGRYELCLEHEAPVEFDAFVASTIQRCREALSRGEGTLVTVNVRATAQETRAQLEVAGLDPLLLSGDMTPSHRLAVIAEIKRHPARVVVSTQCVEAGVDLDMHHVIRDLAPLDALVQIAGRCNRHAHRATPGTVTVVHLKNPHGRDDAGDIYDRVLLQCTEAVLAGRARVPEREVLPLCRDYFDRVRKSKYLGGAAFDAWARIEGALDVRKLLRGEDDDQAQVIVVERDPSLKPALFGAFRIEDRWARRSALRALSARLARETVSVSAKVLGALRTAPLGAARELLPGQYDPVYGVDSRRRA